MLNFVRNRLARKQQVPRAFPVTELINHFCVNITAKYRKVSEQTKYYELQAKAKQNLFDQRTNNSKLY